MKNNKNIEPSTDVSGNEYYPLDQDPELARLSNEDPDITASYLGYTSLLRQVAGGTETSAGLLKLAEEHLLLVLQNKGYGRTKKLDDTGPQANNRV